MAIKFWAEGLIVEIHLPNGDTIFGKLLKAPLIQYFGYFDQATRVKSDPVFEVWTMRNELKHMDRILLEEMSPEDRRNREFYKIDPIDNSVSIYSEGTERPATVAEVRHLECAAAWSLVHIQERFLAEKSGQISKFKKSMERGLFD